MCRLINCLKCLDFFVLIWAILSPFQFFLISFFWKRYLSEQIQTGFFEYSLIWGSQVFLVSFAKIRLFHIFQIDCVFCIMVQHWRTYVVSIYLVPCFPTWLNFFDIGFSKVQLPRKSMLKIFKGIRRGDCQIRDINLTCEFHE